MSKKLSRADRKEQRKKTLRSPIQALRPQSHKAVQAKPAADEGEGASAAIGSPIPDRPKTGGAKPRDKERAKKQSPSEGPPSGRKVEAAALSAGSTSGPRSVRTMSAATAKKKRSEGILLVVVGLVALAAVILLALQWFGSRKSTSTSETTNAPAAEPEPTGPPVDTSPPTIVTALPRPQTTGKAAPTATATAAPTTAPTATAKPTSPTSTSATATPPKKPKATPPPKIVTEDPYN